MPDLFLDGKWCSAVLNGSQSLEPYEGCDRTYGSLSPVQVPGFTLYPFTMRVWRTGARSTVASGKFWPASAASRRTCWCVSWLCRGWVHPAWGPEWTLSTQAFLICWALHSLTLTSVSPLAVVATNAWGWAVTHFPPSLAVLCWRMFFKHEGG